MAATSLYQQIFGGVVKFATRIAYLQLQGAAIFRKWNGTCNKQLEITKLSASVR
jgi:hypothetical protein